MLGKKAHIRVNEGFRPAARRLSDARKIDFTPRSCFLFYGEGHGLTAVIASEAKQSSSSSGSVGKGWIASSQGLLAMTTLTFECVKNSRVYGVI
jgi:hypothetical protein